MNENFENVEVQENEVVENTTENNDVVAVAADEQPQGLTTGETVGGLALVGLAGYGAYKITKKVFFGDKKHNEPSLISKGWAKIKGLRKKKEEPVEEAQEAEVTAE